MTNYIDTVIFSGGLLNNQTIRLYSIGENERLGLVIGTPLSSASMRLDREQAEELRTLLSYFLDKHDADFYDAGWQKGFEAGVEAGREEACSLEEYERAYADGVNDARQRMIEAWTEAAGL